MSDPVLEAIGPRLRAARMEQKLTLDDLASRAGISVSTLSRLESGKRQANLELLLPLSRQLQISMDALLQPVARDPRITPARTTVNGVAIVRLSAANSPIHTFRMTYPPRATMPAQRSHDGHDWVYVLSGTLRLLLGEQDLVLKTGEAAEFDTRVPHSMGSADARPVEVLSIFGEAGAREHTEKARRSYA
ncbi:XRE family transcriptional regulator [Microbacterium sp. STN6]|uniref:helix-turn-helix domain-containing protein n=1 Tax=Microbacterium sp. STN6 TaxID=2995588 RepID=UPI0022609312|nr:XRE family transcriptional regulator [Microbacterium sp. STN6]MCX7522588.1 XRE family transcriptional regulator [Microbacterium sp. STN6]